MYTALASLSSIDDSACPDRNFSNSRIRECSFSHPDKIYVCMNQDRRLLITGKIGVSNRMLGGLSLPLKN